MAARKPYVLPWNAGSQSTDRAIANRLARLINALDTEITGYTVADCGVRDDLAEFRRKLVDGIKREGWELSWGDRNRARVRAPKRTP